jgi:hypothetical protein
MRATISYVVRPETLAHLGRTDAADERLILRAARKGQIHDRANEVRLIQPAVGVAEPGRQWRLALNSGFAYRHDAAAIGSCDYRWHGRGRHIDGGRTSGHRTAFAVAQVSLRPAVLTYRRARIELRCLARGPDRRDVE